MVSAWAVLGLGFGFLIVFDYVSVKVKFGRYVL